MIFANAIARPLVFSKVGDFFSGGFARTPEIPSGSTRTVDAPKVGDAPSGRPAPEHQGFDQTHVDLKVEGFEAPGHASGTRPPGDTPDVNNPRSPQLDSYKAEQQRKWQAQQDAKSRDKLFAQEQPGRVDGKEVEPFSSTALSDESASLSAAAKAKVEKAAPARNGSLFRTAAIALPFSIAGLTVAGAATAYIKKLIDGPESTDGLTKQDAQNARIVEQSQKDVFTAANALNDLKGDAHIAPDLSWAMKDDDARMDALEEIVDIVEEQLTIEAKKLGIPFSAASTGPQKEDIEGRALAIESRLAAVTALFRNISSKLTAETA